MGICMAIASQKGGVGKTTLTANVSAAFADLKFKTLIVETDPQGSLPRAFGLDRYDIERGLYGCAVSGDDPGLAVTRDVFPMLDILPANTWSHEEESFLAAALENDPRLIRTVLSPLADAYDYIVIDCPPGLGAVTRACLIAADRYLVPVQAEAMNIPCIQRFNVLAEDVKTRENPGLSLEGFVVTMADTRTRHANTVIEQLSQEHPDKLVKTIIPRSIRVAEEPVRGKPTVLASPSSRAGKAFQSLADEILGRHARDRVASEPSVSAGMNAGNSDSESDEAWVQVLHELNRTGPVSG